jgi:hypothetical protein
MCDRFMEYSEGRQLKWFRPPLIVVSKIQRNFFFAYHEAAKLDRDHGMNCGEVE